MLGGCGVALNVASEPNDNPEKAKKAKELTQLQKRIARITRDLARTQGQKSAADIALHKVEQNLNLIGKKLRKIQLEITKREQALLHLREQIAPKQQELQQQKQLLIQQLRANYAYGRQQPIKILLNQEHPQQLQRVLTYYNYLNRARSEIIADIHEKVSQLTRLENDVGVEKRLLSQLKNQQKQAQNQLKVEYLERREILAALTKDISNKDRLLDQLKQQERHLQEVIKALENALHDIPADDKRFTERFVKQKGHLIWPTAGRLTAKFGARREVGNLRWRGVVIEADPGTAVRAIFKGRIAFAEWLRGYGLLIIIDHGNGYMSLYGHNQSLYKEIGEWVEAGEQIASVGASGGHKQSNLYFEIRHQGKPLDPSIWCRKSKQGFVGITQNY